MGTMLSSFESCSGQTFLPYTVDQIDSVMIDFVMGQLPEQIARSDGDDYYESSGHIHSVDMFMNIFGEPKVKKLFGDNYLFYYQLKDNTTLVVSVSAFAYDINRIQINDFISC
jgi:hypothetical protein